MSEETKKPEDMTPEEIRETESYKAFPHDKEDLSAMKVSGEFEEEGLFNKINVEEDYAGHVWLMDNWDWFKQYVDKMIGEEVPGDGAGEQKTAIILIGMPKWACSHQLLLTKKDNPVYDFFLDKFYAVPRASDEEIEKHEENLHR